MKKFIIFSLVLCLSLSAFAVYAAQKNSNFMDGKFGLVLNDHRFAPGEEIIVYFGAYSTFASNAWIGIVPSNVLHGKEEVNDSNDIAYKYIQGKASGVMKFKAPNKPGSYDIRMNDADSKGNEIASITFLVVKGDDNSAMIELDKKTYKPGEDIKVSFRALPGFAKNAWIGIIHSSVKHGSEKVNDQNDVAYQYLTGRTSGVLTFKAPSKPGKYDFRMHDTDSNGKEITYISFLVK